MMKFALTRTCLPVIVLVLVAGLLVSCDGRFHNDAYSVSFVVADESGSPLAGEELAVYVPVPCDRYGAIHTGSFEGYAEQGFLLQSDLEGRVEFDVPAWTGLCLPSGKRNQDDVFDWLSPGNRPIDCWVQFCVGRDRPWKWLVVADRDHNNRLPRVKGRLDGKEYPDIRHSTVDVSAEVDFDSRSTSLKIIVYVDGGA